MDLWDLVGTIFLSLEFLFWAFCNISIAFIMNNKEFNEDILEEPRRFVRILGIIFYFPAIIMKKCGAGSRIPEGMDLMEYRKSKLLIECSAEIEENIEDFIGNPANEL